MSRQRADLDDRRLPLDWNRRKGGSTGGGSQDLAIDGG